MPSDGKHKSKKQLKLKSAQFFLDECLPYRVAEVLNSFGHPITSWHEEFQGQQGLLDTPLIQYLGAKEYIWITKDNRAKAEHEPEIVTAQISVVWVAGLDRDKQNTISTKDLHRMLTDKLDDIYAKVLDSKKPLYFRLHIKSGNPDAGNKPVLTVIALDTIFSKIRQAKHP